MQNSFIIFQKLLVLFGFMLIGYLSYKKKWISDDTSLQISGLIVNIFNPALIISGCVIDFCISDRRTSTCGKFCTILRKCSNPTLHDHYRGIFSEDAADRSFQRHQDVSVYIFKDAGDPNDRSICDPAVSFRSCSLGDHGINVWNAKWKHGSDDGNRLWIRQFHLQQRNCVDNFIIDHYITNCGILDLRK